MRWRFILNCLFCTTLCVASLAGAFAVAAEFPFRATVSRNQAPLHCGPGENYYNTSNLAAGTAVEVYQQGANGWCAIRPTTESFSLIPSNQTRLADGESLAEITSKQAVSWVGSSTEDPPQLLWQVQLNEGEVVEIVGIVRRENLEGTEKDLWYKIRPPAGEFRYMRIEDLTPTPDATTTNVQQLNHVEQVTHFEQVALPAAASPVEAPAVEEVSSQWRVRTNPRARNGESAGGDLVSIPEPIRVASRAGTPRTALPPLTASNKPSSLATNPSGTLSAKRTPATVGPLSTDPDTLLNQLDVELSLMAAQPVASWDFTLFEQKLEKLNQLETNTKQRTRMVRFRNRLEPFQKLHTKHEGLAALSPPLETTSVATEAAETPSMVPEVSPQQTIGTGLALATPPSESSLNPKEENTTEVVTDGGATAEDIPAEYDGVGYLMPVISREQQAPPFALLDKSGNVLGFVSPVPGLNLRRYVKQEVGVVGQRGYLPKYQATHLTAQRIIVLDRHR